jgi:predicted enzyme related to lactoylglutathione lyase
MNGKMASLALTFVGIISLTQSASLQQLPKTAPRDTKEIKMFQGLRTVIYHVDDLERAKEWYAKALGVKPYFDQPFYVGFNIGGFELGLDPDMTGVTKGSNAIAYWGVKDAAVSYKRLLDLGAKKHREVQDVGSNIKVATVTDPFGNIFGIIENPHFKFEDVK